MLLEADEEEAEEEEDAGRLNVISSCNATDPNCAEAAEETEGASNEHASIAEEEDVDVDGSTAIEAVKFKSTDEAGTADVNGSSAVRMLFGGTNEIDSAVAGKSGETVTEKNNTDVRKQPFSA